MAHSQRVQEDLTLTVSRLTLNEADQHALEGAVSLAQELLMLNHVFIRDSMTNLPMRLEDDAVLLWSFNRDSVIDLSEVFLRILSRHYLIAPDTSNSEHGISEYGNDFDVDLDTEGS